VFLVYADFPPAGHAAKRAAGVIVGHKSPDQFEVSFLASGGLNCAHELLAHAVPPVITVDVDE
jgi:hypothetical protein